MLDVCFHPESLNSDVRVERVSLFVEGAETQYLTVTGMCVQQEAEAAVVTFSTNVRCSETKNVSVKNTTNTKSLGTQAGGEQRKLERARGSECQGRCDG